MEQIRMSKKFRGFSFTDFEMDDSFYQSKDIDWRYLVIGSEICPSSARAHWQGYIYFKNPRSFESVRKLFAPRHIEASLGSPEENRAYCLKENKPVIEDGEVPKQGKRTDLEAVQVALLNKEDEKKISEEFFTQWVRYHKAFERFAQLHTIDRTWKTEVIVLWGNSGTGKTKRAHDMGAKIIEYHNGFIQNYNNEDIVCFDDFDCTNMPRHIFLKLTDRYPYTVNIKNGEKKWNPKIIVFTSNFNPDNWYEGDNAVKRRLDKVEHL